MKKYFTGGVLFLSAVFGIIVFFLSSFFSEWELALLLGALSALILSIVLPAGFAHGDKKYKKLLNDIAAPYIIEERVECVINGRASHGYMVLKDDSLFLLSIVNNKAIRFEIKREEIKKISLTNDFYINIFTDYNKYIRVISGNSTEITKKLEKAGFGVRKEN